MSILVYILQVSVCLAIFYSFYYFLLRRETLFESNRTYILLSLVSSFALPLLRIYVDTALHDPDVIAAPVYVGTYVQEITYELSARPVTPFPWDTLLKGVYALGVALLSIRLYRAVREINQIRRSGQQINILGYPCIISDKVKTPFSFFRSIYLPEDHRFNEDELREVVSHELAHVHGKHTFDIILVEVACIFLWPSPLIYLYRKAIRDIHEYMADAAVVKDTPWEHYADLLLHQQQGQLQNVLSNQLIFSQLKKRILMMNKQRSGSLARFKYLGVVPILLVALVLFSFREKGFEDRGSLNDDTVRSGADKVLVFNVDQDQAIHFDLLSLKNDRFSQDADTIPKAHPSVPEKDMSKPFTMVEQMPQFPGCESEQDETLRSQCQAGKMYQFIGEHLKYPEEDRAKGLEGMGVVQFVVQPDGEMSDIQVVRSPSPAMEKEMMRLMQAMADLPQKWIPGRHEGIPVPVALTLPIKFKLDDKAADLTAENETPVIFPGCAEITDKAEQQLCSQQGIYKFIGQHLKYPEADQKNRIEGTAIAKFVINENGRMTNIEVVRSPSETMKTEVLRVMELMANSAGAWRPARKEGKVVASEMVLPVKFKLEDKKEGSAEKSPMATSNVRTIQVVPNPANEEISIETVQGATTVAIFDESGSQVWSEKIAQGNIASIRISVSKFKPGWYAIHLIGEEILATGKFSVVK